MHLDHVFSFGLNVEIILEFNSYSIQQQHPCLLFFILLACSHQKLIVFTNHPDISSNAFFFVFLCSQRSKQRLSKELSDCVVYCKSIHFRSFKHSRIHSKFYEVASFTESKARKHLRDAGRSNCSRC